MPPPIQYTTQSITFAWANRTVTATVVTQAVATLTSANMGGGSGASNAINPPGWSSGDCPHHHNRGHLIGNKLGGPGDVANNLVTLTAGTNHPIMYEFENGVYNIVMANPNVNFTYTVVCGYDADDYSALQEFPIPGAANNPFCLFPAPAKLTLSLSGPNHHYTVAEIAQAINGNVNNNSTGLTFPNGVYKLYQGIVHTNNNCWSVEHNPNDPQVQNAATQYAQALGY